MLSARALPHIDSYSFTRSGQPWFAWEWGSDVLTGIAYQASGLGGVAFLYALAIAGSVWLWFRLNWVLGGNFLIACLFAAPMLSTANIHWLARAIERKSAAHAAAIGKSQLHGRCRRWR